MKLLDNAAKRSFERDARGLLHLTRCLPLDAPAKIFPVEWEISVPQMSMDTAYQIRAGTHRVEMVEALAVWNAREVERIAGRANLLSHVPRYRKLPIRLVVVLLTPRRVPRKLPERFDIRRGDTGHYAIPRFFPMWEVDPAPVIALGRPALMPWVPLMKSPTVEQLQAAADAVAGDDELTAMFYTVASIYYERGFLKTLLARFEDMFTPRLVAQTPAGKEYGALMRREGRKKGREEGLRQGLEKGRAEGIEQGVGKGRTEGEFASTLAHIREFLKSRHPSIRVPALEEKLANPEAANDLLRRLFRASSAVEVRSILAPLRNGSH